MYVCENFAVAQVRELMKMRGPQPIEPYIYKHIIYAIIDIVYHESQPIG